MNTKSTSTKRSYSYLSAASRPSSFPESASGARALYLGHDRPSEGCDALARESFSKCRQHPAVAAHYRGGHISRKSAAPSHQIQHLLPLHTSRGRHRRYSARALQLKFLAADGENGRDNHFHRAVDTL